MSDVFSLQRRRGVVVCIIMLIAADHILRVGSYLQGELYILYYGYFSDFILPFGCYFLLCAAELQMPVLRRWEAKFAIVFLMASMAETCQYFGIPVLGVTFDPLDYFIYAIGAMSAAIVDTHVFSRIFIFWNMEKV